MLLITLIEQFSIIIECRKTKEITLTNHNRRKQRNEPIRFRSKCLWFWFCFIGWESDASFANQSLSAIKQRERECEITFGTQLKTALLLQDLAYLNLWQSWEVIKLSVEISGFCLGNI